MYSNCFVHFKMRGLMITKANSPAFH